MSIYFTQYIPPHGRRERVSIERPDEIEAMAQEIRARGFVFECEKLSNGVVSLTVTDPEEGDVCIELAFDEKKVPEHVDNLVRRAYKETK